MQEEEEGKVQEEEKMAEATGGGGCGTTAAAREDVADHLEEVSSSSTSSPQQSNPQIEFSVLTREIPRDLGEEARTLPASVLVRRKLYSAVPVVFNPESRGDWHGSAAGSTSSTSRSTQKTSSSCVGGGGGSASSLSEEEAKKRDEELNRQEEKLYHPFPVFRSAAESLFPEIPSLAGTEIRMGEVLPVPTDRAKLSDATSRSLLRVFEIRLHVPKAPQNEKSTGEVDWDVLEVSDGSEVKLNFTKTWSKFLCLKVVTSSTIGQDAEKNITKTSSQYQLRGLTARKKKDSTLLKLRLGVVASNVADVAARPACESS